jgi:hypothetical protein
MICGGRKWCEALADGHIRTHVGHSRASHHCGDYGYLMDSARADAAAY